MALRHSTCFFCHAPITEVLVDGQFLWLHDESGEGLCATMSPVDDWMTYTFAEPQPPEDNLDGEQT